MKFEELGPDALWHCYQRGYSNLMRSGVYFRQLLRPVLSHTYFQRALPLLHEYAAATHRAMDLSPSFRERLDACPLSPRDLIHLDYAICLGYVELEGLDPSALALAPVLQWPGPATDDGLFIAADALISGTGDLSQTELTGTEFDHDFVFDTDDDDIENDEEDELDGTDETDDDESSPPFDT